jgi:serine/threonine protein kinase/Flp pilus assembly protein TadD
MEVPPERRGAFVAAACADDPSLEQEVQALVDQAGSSTSFLEPYRERLLLKLPGDETPLFHCDEMISDRYRVVRFIAKGGMGEVYEVEDKELGANVALKTVTWSAGSRSFTIERFKREIQLARKVTHPNVCRVFDVGHHMHPAKDDICFLTMELLNGETLADRLDRLGPMTEEQASPLVGQMVAALSTAHDLGIIHRDFKPGNVILLDGTVPEVLKITDFGLARSLDSDETWITRGGEFIGTPDFMAPEQFSGRSSVETDVYALGLVIFTMVKGKLPSNRAAPFSDEESEVGGGKTKVGKAWRGAIQKCLIANPDERFHSVDDAWRALSGQRPATQKGWAGIASGLKRFRLAIAATLVLMAAVAGLSWKGIFPNPFHRLPEQKHLAVLPFKNIGNDPRNQPFADGIVESLTSNLSQLERYQKSFWIVPSSDSRGISSLEDAYRKLNITLAVTGSVQRSENDLVLTTNLVDAKNHKQLASRTLRTTSADMDKLQDELWQSVADMVDLQVNPEVAQQIAAGGTKQPGAYELYEQGVGYASRMDTDSIDRAIELFDKAVGRDPNYALAYAGLGGAYASKYELTRDPQWIDKAINNGQRALQLNDQLMPVHMAMGKIYQETGQLDKALAEYRTAQERDPAAIEAAYRTAQVYEKQGKLNEAEATFKSIINRRPGYWPAYSGLGTLYNRQGKFALAASQFQTMIDLQPDNSVGYHDLGGTYIGMGRFADAVTVLKKGLSLKETSRAWTNLGAAYMYLKQYPQAADAMKRATELDPHNDILWRNLGDSYRQIPGKEADARQAYQKALEAAVVELKVNPNNVEVISGIALYHAHLGAKAEAETYINKALKLSPKDSDVLFTSALVYEIIGHREKAIAAIDQAVKAGYSIQDVNEEPELRWLRSDPRYQHWFESHNSGTNESPS